MHKTILKITSVVALGFAAAFLCTVVYVYTFSAQWRAEPAVGTSDVTQRCAVVFGAAVWPGGVPSDALRDRIEAAVALYTHDTVDCLILSGAPSAYEIHEVDVMRDVALAHDIPSENIYFDYTGTSTLATISHLNKDLSYVLVSNDFHLARISLLAHKRDLQDVALYAAPYLHGRYIKETEFVIREAVALWYYFFVL